MKAVFYLSSYLVELIGLKISSHGHNMKISIDKHPESNDRLVVEGLPGVTDDVKRSDMTEVEVIIRETFTPQPVKGTQSSQNPVPGCSCTFCETEI